MEFIIQWARGNENEHRYYYWTGNNGMPFAHVKEGIMKTDSRLVLDGFSDLKFYPAFTAEGINHRIEGSVLKREIPDMTRYVDINTLEELTNLQREIGLPLCITHSESYTFMESVDGNSFAPYKSTQVPERWYITIDDSDANYPSLD